jgi:hypothetical protein
MRSIWLRWVGLLDTRETAESLAAVRIVVGATVLLTLAHAWWSGATAFWVATAHGGVGATEPGVLDLFGGLTERNVDALLVLGLAASALLTVGRCTRAAALVTWVCFRTLAFSNPLSGGSGDNVVSNVLLIVLLSGSGRAWSLDALRVPGSAMVSAWPRYLAIGQLVTIYLSAGWHKASGAWMPFGSLDAIWYVVHNPIWQRRMLFFDGDVIGRLSQLATFTTWLFEISSPLLLLAFYFRATPQRPGHLRRWFNRWDFRAKYLVVGFCLHLGIELILEVGAFFGGMMALYAACFHPDELRALASRVRRHGCRRNGTGPARGASTDGSGATSGDTGIGIGLGRNPCGASQNCHATKGCAQERV